MDEMLADISREYVVGSGEQGQPLEVQISTGSLPLQMRKYTMALM
jgi:hypothetical protein